MNRKNDATLAQKKALVTAALALEKALADIRGGPAHLVPPSERPKSAASKPSKKPVAFSCLACDMLDDWFQSWWNSL